MLQDYFVKYLNLTNISESSINKYVRAIFRINRYLEDYDFSVKNLFAVTSLADLELVKEFLNTNKEFLEQDTRGNRMYSVAFRHFYRFACEDKQFFRTDIDKMDMIIPKPDLVTVTSIGWKRNQLIVEHALESSKYMCENNNDHHSFISKSTGKEYMEGHHIIPLKYQDQFKDSIDVYANIVCLCPICHKMMHYGMLSERQYAAEKLYDERNARLIKSGIDLSKNDFLKMAVSL